MIKKLLVVALVALSSSSVLAETGFFGNNFVVLNVNNSTDTFYDLNPQTLTENADFNGAFLGTFDISLGNTLVLAGGEFRTFQDPGQDVSSVFINYSIRPTGGEGTFQPFSINFVSQTGNASGGLDKFWQTTDGSVNLLNGLAPGNYDFVVFGSATTTQGDRFYSNNANNYTATFTVVPEPSSLSLLAGPAILGAWFFVRRKRA